MILRWGRGSKFSNLRQVGDFYIFRSKSSHVHSVILKGIFLFRLGTYNLPLGFSAKSLTKEAKGRASAKCESKICSHQRVYFGDSKTPPPALSFLLIVEKLFMERIYHENNNFEKLSTASIKNVQLSVFNPSLFCFYIENMDENSSLNREIEVLEPAPEILNREEKCTEEKRVAVASSYKVCLKCSK